MSEYYVIGGFKSISASPTDIWELEDTKTGEICIAKIFILSFVTVEKADLTKRRKEVPETAELLIGETKTYGILKNKILDSPKLQGRNFVPYITHFELTSEQMINTLIANKRRLGLTDNQLINNLCDNTRSMLLQTRGRKAINDKSASNALNPLWRAEKAVYDSGSLFVGDVQYGFLVTKKIEQLTLYDYIQEKEKYASSLCQIVFKILVAIRSMIEIGLNQNDLHFGNILMNKNYKYTPDDCASYCVFVDDYITIFEGTDQDYTPLIFDFDRSATVSRDNRELGKYEKYGNCPNYGHHRDYIKFICGLYKICENHRHAEIRELAPEILNSLILTNDLRQRFKTEPTSCFFTEGPTSIQCDEKYVEKNMASMSDAMKFFREKAFGRLYWAEIGKSWNAISIKAHVAAISAGLDADRYFARNLQYINGSISQKTVIRGLKGPFKGYFATCP